MKTRISILCWLIGISLQIAGTMRADELPWQDDYPKTLAEAAEKHQPVLLDFSASWCGPCRMMESTTFADAGVRAEMKGYLLVKVDFDQARELVAHYRVEAIPTCILLNQFGEKVAEHVGYINAAKFAAWLHENEDEAFAKESQAEVSAAKFKFSGQCLESGDATTRTTALGGLTDTYCTLDARDNGQAKLAANELRAWFGHHPDRAVPLLNDRRLAVRIFFASLFAEKLGAAFQFDPWDAASAREVALARVTGQIGPGR